MNDHHALVERLFQLTEELGTVLESGDCGAKATALRTWCEAHRAQIDGLAAECKAATLAVLQPIMSAERPNHPKALDALKSAEACSGNADFVAAWKLLGGLI